MQFQIPLHQSMLRSSPLKQEMAGWAMGIERNQLVGEASGLRKVCACVLHLLDVTTLFVQAINLSVFLPKVFVIQKAPT